VAKERDLAVFIAVYDDVEAAMADLGAIEELHKDDFVGAFDAAVVDQENGKPRVVKRLDRPFVRVIPEALGFGPLSRGELKEAATALGDSHAGLVVIGQPTFEKGFDKAVTRATKVLKHTIDATTEEIANELKDAAKS